VLIINVASQLGKSGLGDCVTSSATKSTAPGAAPRSTCVAEPACADRGNRV